MSIFEIIVIGLGLSMDCFAVSLSFGTSRMLTWRDIFKMAVYFGIFQGFMTFLGWLIGNGIQSLIASVDHWIAFGILAFIGIRMIAESFRVEKEKKAVDIRKTMVLLSLSLATSIDAFMTGISFGFIRVNIWIAIIVITLITFFISVLGGKIGEKSTFIPARRAELIGGIVLFIIGLKILMDHLGIL